jgi:phytoene dehydrogenase-like protein
MKYDVIVIGGGLGGLTAGAKLAKEGKSVLLLEQHDRPGGCATTFKRKEYIMEVGLHEMDGLHPTDGKNKIFDDLGIFDRVTFLPVPEFYRFLHRDTDLVMPHDREAAIDMLKTRFPDQSDGIDAYFHRLVNAKRINVMERNQPDISIGEFLDRTFSNEEIKLVLLGNLGYFHDDPYSLSLRYFSIAEGAYFNGRANFIQGGSQKLSDALMAIIRENGGKVLLNHEVTSLQARNGHVAGVTFVNNLPGKHTPVEAKADRVVAGAALPVIASLLGTEGSTLRKQIEKQTIGASLLTVYLGFSKPLRAIGHNHYSTFVFDDSISTQKDILANNHSDFTKRSFTFVDYSQIDSGLAPEGKSVGALCCTDYTADWEPLSREAYKARKHEAGQHFIHRIDKLIPGSARAVLHLEVGTAKTVERYTGNPQGAVYGFAQHPNRQLTDRIEGIDNIYIASAWGKFGGGFSGAVFSGYMTAVDILRGR